MAMAAAVSPAVGRSITALRRPAKGTSQEGPLCCCFLGKSSLKHVESKGSFYGGRFRGRKGGVVMVAELTRTSDADIQAPPPAAKHLNRVISTAKGKAHSLTAERLEIVKSLDSWAEEALLPLLKDPDTNWQPQDYLPVSSDEDFLDKVKELRERSAGLSDEYLVCLVGDTITEEALPTYQTMLNTLDGTRDETGADPSPWGIWTRAWTAEENRHGDLLHTYLYLTGRVDMKAVQRTTQYLIGSGMDPKTENNPYLGFLYTSFQERATFVSHGNTARHAKKLGDERLGKICGIIAADEKRHEKAYCRIVEKLYELDPDGAMLAFQDMMKKQIVMPAHLMYDGESETLFKDFSEVAQRTGVYTAADYADIMQHLIDLWKVEHFTNLSPDAEAAQQYLCKLPERVRRLGERAAAKAKKTPQEHAKFSWIFNREVALL